MGNVINKSKAELEKKRKLLQRFSDEGLTIPAVLKRPPFNKMKQKQVRNLIMDVGIKFKRAKAGFPSERGTTLPMKEEDQKISPEDQKLLDDMKRNYSPAELKAMQSKQSISGTGRIVVPDIHFDGERFRGLVISDSHIGAKAFKEKYFDQAIAEGKKEGCEALFCPGDQTEGLHVARKGHAFELDLLGYDPQRDEAVKQYSKWDKPQYHIGGNHDEWFLKHNNANIAQDICDRIPNATYMGIHFGEVKIKGQKVHLLHGLRGSSYALSYRPQKDIEEIRPDDKPKVYIQGHYHKWLSFFYRSVWGILPGAICMQSDWMKAMGLGNHTGFAIFDMWVNKGGVSKFRTQFYPFYS